VVEDHARDDDEDDVFALLKKFHVGVGAVDGHPIRGLSGLVQMVGFL
jgi:hypothetical protein